jgi:hypothetical protein
VELEVTDGHGAGNTRILAADQHAQHPPRNSDRVLRDDARQPQAARGTSAS